MSLEKCKSNYFINEKTAAGAGLIFAALFAAPLSQSATRISCGEGRFANVRNDYAKNLTHLTRGTGWLTLRIGACRAVRGAAPVFVVMDNTKDNMPVEQRVVSAAFLEVCPEIFSHNKFSSITQHLGVPGSTGTVIALKRSAFRCWRNFLPAVVLANTFNELEKNADKEREEKTSFVRVGFSGALAAWMSTVPQNLFAKTYGAPGIKFTPQMLAGLALFRGFYGASISATMYLSGITYQKWANDISLLNFENEEKNIQPKETAITKVLNDRPTSSLEEKFRKSYSDSVLER